MEGAGLIMAPFLLFLFILGIAATVIGQSLIERSRNRWFVPLLSLTLPVLLSPFLIQIGKDSIVAVFNNVALVQYLSLVMISEGILTIWIGLDRITSHYDSNSPRKRTSLFFLPSSSCIAASPAAALYIMNKTTSLNYGMIALFSGAAFAFGVILAQEAFRLVIKDWGRRFELRMLCALVQIIGASFIPLVMQPISFTGEAAKLSWNAIGLFLVVSAFFILAGFLLTTLLQNWRRRINGSR